MSVDQGSLACPDCGRPMIPRALDLGLFAAGYRGSEVRVLGCTACSHAWVPRQVFAELIAAAAPPAHEVDPRKVLRQTLQMPKQVTYRPCPACSVTMDRRNFARYSGVVIDRCIECGSLLRPEDLGAILAFVRSGGLLRRPSSERGDTARRRPVLTTPIPRPPGPSWTQALWTWLRSRLRQRTKK